MKKILSLSLGLIMACCSAAPICFAEEINPTEETNCLGSPETNCGDSEILLISEDVIAPAPDDSADRFQFSETNLNSSSELRSSGFFLSNIIEDHSAIDGIGFFLGSTLKTFGSYDYGIHAGVDVIIDGDYKNDLFVAGSNVTISESAALGRDVYLAASNATISSDIPGNLYATGTSLTLENTTISGDVMLSFGNIAFGNNVEVLGSLSYNGDATISGTVPDTETNVYYNPTTRSSSDTFLTQLINTTLSFCGYVVVLTVLALIVPKWFIKLSTIMKSYQAQNGLTDILTGLAVLIGVPLAAILLLFTLIGTPVSLLGLIIYGIFIYLSKLLTGYFIGGFLVKDSAKKITMIGRGTAGLAIIEVVSIIPFIGDIVALLSLLMGLGLAVRSLR